MKTQEILIALVISVLFTSIVCSVLSFNDKVIALSLLLIFFIISLLFQKQVIKIITYRR